jgi:hypothetical protein
MLEVDPYVCIDQLPYFEAIEWPSLLQQEPCLELYVAFAEAKNCQVRSQ